MRLIDADEVIDAIEHHIKNDCPEEFKQVWVSISAFIANRETAYDTDKVVGQIEKSSFRSEINQSVVDLVDAIDIILNGGKE